MLDATGVVDWDRTSWSGVGAPTMNIGWVVPQCGSCEDVVHQHEQRDDIGAFFLLRWSGRGRPEVDWTRSRLCDVA